PVADHISVGRRGFFAVPLFRDSEIAQMVLEWRLPAPRCWNVRSVSALGRSGLENAHSGFLRLSPIGPKRRTACHPAPGACSLENCRPDELLLLRIVGLHIGSRH